MTAAGITRCIHCRLRLDLCVCALSPRLALQTRLVVLMHTKEWRRSSNTGHYARFAVEGAEVIQHGHSTNRLTADKIVPAGYTPLIVFPGLSATTLTDEVLAAQKRPVALIVPDGNWGQASQMIKRIPGLSALPTVALPRPPETTLRLRRNLDGARMSTLEAIAQALGLFEGRAVEESILTYYHHIVTRMMHLRGRMPLPPSP